MRQDDTALFKESIFVDFLDGLSFSSGRNYDAIPNLYLTHHVFLLLFFNIYLDTIKAFLSVKR